MTRARWEDGWLFVQPEAGRCCGVRRCSNVADRARLVLIREGEHELTTWAYVCAEHRAAGAVGRGAAS